MHAVTRYAVSQTVRGQGRRQEHSVARYCLHCCKGEQLSLWRMAKNWGVWTPNPLNRLT